MPVFKLDDVDNLEVYKKSRNASLSRITDKLASFIYSKKHTFKLPQKKVQPIFIYENGKIDPAILNAIKSNAGGSTAEGSCYKNKDDVLIFRVAKGKLEDFSMVPKFQIGEALATASNV